MRYAGTLRSIPFLIIFLILIFVEKYACFAGFLKKAGVLPGKKIKHSKVLAFFVII